MATTANDYKLYGRLPRFITVEDLFNLGMSYVDTPLASGFSRLLVNYDLRNQGTSLVPRGGMRLLDTTLSTTLLTGNKSYAVHHVGMTLVKSIDGQDATVHKYILVAPVVEHPVTHKMCYYFNDLHCFIETDAGFLHASVTTTWYTNTKTKLTKIHNVSIEANNYCNKGIFVSVDTNTYIPVKDVANASRQFMQLVLQFTSANSFSVALLPLVPKEIPATQVINAGYNLMKADPYSFANTQNATGALVLGGAIPKNAAGQIKLTADVGETLTYHLNYTYPASDVGKQYMAQWEITDVTTGTNPITLQQVRKSTVYNPGDDIAFAFTVPYKQFTLVIKVYYKSDVDAHTYVSDEDDYNKLTPLKVITVSSYYTTAGVSGNTANLTPKSYDMATCTDMCTWQQRTVMWGVTNAPTTLFVSQPNLPEYVPYPNNVEIFPDDIVHCVPYLTFLLVFTKTKLYQLALTSDGVNTYYTTKCIQEHLIMTDEDAATISVVKNMVYFKSDNYYYMIVPNSRVGSGELQLAPVSRPIERLLDNFEESIKKIIDEVYNIDYTFSLREGADDSYTVTLTDYTNYLDGAIMRNVYKCKLTITKAGVLSDTRYIDFILNYDTVLRAWTMYLYEDTQYRRVPYESTITTGVTLLTAKPTTSSSKDLYLQLVKLDPTLPSDNAPLTADNKERKLLNYQMLDTGYRAHYPTYQKRFREIQFTINNTTQDLLNFYTSFTLDDAERKELFTYQTEQITDPASPDYGLIYVERVLAESIPIAGAIKLEDGWVLDFSKFPDITVSKVKYKVSGKGYLGKIIILSRNEKLYELLGTTWVYRKMNAR